MKTNSEQLVKDRIRELWENTDFISTLFESLTGYAIIAADFDANIIAYNEGARQIYGYAPEEIIGKENIEIFFPKAFIEAGELQRIIDDLIGRGRFSYEGEKVRKTGEQFPAQVLFTLTRDRNGKLVGFVEIVEDLTERKRAEEALAASKAYTESIIRNFLDTLIVVDAEAKIQTMNPATLHLLGYIEEELIGHPVSIIFAEEEEEEEVHRLFQFFRESKKAEALRLHDTIRNRELTYKTKDGQLIPMSFNASVLTDEAGNVTGVVAGAKDITELKLAEAELRKEKNFSENIIATIPDSLLVIDKDLRIKSANQSFYKVFGIEPEKVIGSRITEILHDKEGRLSTELTKLFGTEDMLENFELRYQSEKLGERIFNIAARGIIVEEEEEEEELVVLEDITRRKHVEKALEMSKENFRNMVEKNADGIIIVDRNGIVRFFNPVVESLFGRKAEELQGELFGFPVITGKSTEVDIIRSGGEISIGEIRVVETSWEDESAYLVSIRDITERKRAEDKIKRKNAELQRLNTDLDDYVRFVSHDVRAPLRHIKALSLFINEDYGDKLDENGKEYIRKITTTCDGAETMINELLELARMKGIELVREEVNLEDEIKEIETELESFLEENNGRIEVDEHLPSLLAHRAWMKELFLNLIMNGVKHNDKEEKVLRIGFKDEEDTLLFFVADNGIGIEDKYRAEIFRPFKRVNVEVEGTGLGLSLCKKVVELHDGKIWVESEIGKGSTFFFSFPKNTRTGGRV